MTEIASILRGAIWSPGVKVTCLLHSARSGANLFGDLVRATGGGWAGDIAGYLDLGSSHLDSQSALDRSLGMLEAIKELVKNSSKNGVCVFKIDLQAYAQLDLVLSRASSRDCPFDLRLFIPRLRYLRVVRDPIDRAVSLAAARKSGQWSPIDGETGHRKLDVDASAISEQLGIVLKEDFMMDLLCRELTPQMRCISYAEITLLKQEAMEAYLGLRNANWISGYSPMRYESKRELEQTRVDFLKSLFNQLQMPSLSRMP